MWWVQKMQKNLSVSCFERGRGQVVVVVVDNGWWVGDMVCWWWTRFLVSLGNI
jgi:hypothetical protein